MTDKTAEEKFKDRALKVMPKTLVIFFGFLFGISGFLIFNQINVGMLANNLMDIYVEEKRADIQTRKELELKLNAQGVYIKQLEYRMNERLEKVEQLAHEAN